MDTLIINVLPRHWKVESYSHAICKGEDGEPVIGSSLARSLPLYIFDNWELADIQRQICEIKGYFGLKIIEV